MAVFGNSGTVFSHISILFIIKATAMPHLSAVTIFFAEFLLLKKEYTYPRPPPPPYINCFIAEYFS